MNTKNDAFKISFSKMINRISWDFDMPYHQASNLLMDYSETHGDDSVIALYGFVLWAFAHDKPDLVKGTLAHDLAGRTDKTMLPRSSGYLDYGLQQLL